MVSHFMRAKPSAQQATRKHNQSAESLGDLVWRVGGAFAHNANARKMPKDRPRRPTQRLLNLHTSAFVGHGATPRATSARSVLNRSGEAA